MMLRPLGFGEIFDRAITIYLRNLWPFVGIVLVLLIPAAILQFALGPGQIAQLAAVWQIMQHPGHQPPDPSMLSPTGPLLVLLIVVGFISLCMEPFVFNAVAIGVARLYRGESVEFRACYAQSLRRWPQVIGLLFLGLLLGILWYIGVVIIVMISIFLAVVLFAVSHAVGVLAAIIAVPIILAALLTISPLLVAFAFAMYAVVFEEQGAGAAMGSGFRRVFNRKEFWRALGMAICAGLIATTGSFIVSGVAMVALFFKQVWLYVLLNSVANGLITPFAIVLFAVYYFDVLVRRGELPQAERTAV